MRKIPATMATQHPDNAGAPYWERDGDGFVSVQEEIRECASCFEELGVDEFMWDWEGKYADEAVIDKLFEAHYSYFKKHQLGRDRFLTFRLPNVWKEKGYSLIRALMVILTSEDFACDIKFHSPPLFEAILPMVERAEQPFYIQDSFQKLARFKSHTFTHNARRHADYLSMIPLLEGVDDQINIYRLLSDYCLLHRQRFGRRPVYLRPFLARSDPALVSGLCATVLANKIALADAARFSKEFVIPTFPIIGVGGLPFRGGLNPANVSSFLREYGGVRTVTIQSAFRYDYPLAQVKKAIRMLNSCLPATKSQSIPEKDRSLLKKIIKRFAEQYQRALDEIVADLEPFFAAVPRRRERRLHIGFLAYQRKAGRHYLPRAINFAAALYSLGAPPEFIGTGQALASLAPAELNLLEKYYVNLRSDLARAGQYLNRDNLRALAASAAGWRAIEQDTAKVEAILGIKLKPRTRKALLHKNLSSNLLLLRDNDDAVSRLIVETGKLRGSLG